MLDDAANLIREGFAFALAAAGDDDEVFLRGLRLLERLQHNPVIAGHLEDLRDENRRAQARRIEEYCAQMRDLNQIRQRLEELAPHLFADEVPAVEPSWGHLAFDARIDTRLEGLDDPDCKMTDSFRFIRTYLSRAGEVATVLEASAREIEARETISQRRYRLASASAAAGVQEWTSMMSPLREDWTPEDELGDQLILDRRLVLSEWADLKNQSLNGEPHTTRKMLEAIMSRTAEELLARIGSARSKLALFDRFKTRAQWYDRARLFQVAAGTKRPEDDLVEELAKFLFDAGLNPLTRVRLMERSQEPDIWDPGVAGRVYVEAKQYKESKGARKDIRDGVRVQGNRSGHRLSVGTGDAISRS